MFKIIKTSTYKQLEKDSRWLKVIDKEKVLLDSIISQQNQIIKNLELQLHHLTAKKLPIKKSKNK